MSPCAHWDPQSHKRRRESIVRTLKCFILFSLAVCLLWSLSCGPLSSPLFPSLSTLSLPLSLACLLARSLALVYTDSVFSLLVFHARRIKHLAQETGRGIKRREWEDERQHGPLPPPPPPPPLPLLPPPPPLTQALFGAGYVMVHILLCTRRGL